MTYPQNFEEKIGFDKIRGLICDRCLSTLGSERVAGMQFQTSFDTIDRLLHETEEFTHILQTEDNFPADYFFDIRSSLQRIRIEGTFLDETELFNLRRSLETIRHIVGFFINEEESPYPHLQALAGNVVVFPQLLSRIDQIIDKFGHVKDNASTELSQIRRELNRTLSSISRSLNMILRNAQSEGIVDKEVSPTLREGRLVIPVIPAYKRRIKGIVHDESASGKTVYIEPAEVVEANNRIRELEGEERREIIRILTLFTDELRPHLAEIAHSYEFLADIDFIRAKALFAIEINALLPHFENCRQIEWYHAIHPLLFLSLKKQNKQVVPLDIALTPQQRILLISGPNAGGKSVCLKTTGLLQYMLQCGLLIPVYENSHTGIFDHIFIDIGDEQSIENDLSTYSSHLTNMKFFVKNCNESSLLLIDEFGGGTEPQIGGAIAEVLLDRFNRKKAFGVITTHYQNLKQFAEDTQGIVNGAMLYDRHMMQPLFKLSIGNPGSSFAIEIARKIGLPEDVIADASEKVGSDYIDMDKYLQDIVRDKRYWENKRQNIRHREKQLEEITQRYADNLQEIEKERKRILKEAKQKAEQLIAESNARIENTIRTIKEAEAEKEKTKMARQELHSFKKGLQKNDENDDTISRKIAKIKAKEEKKNHSKKEADAETSKTTTISVGDAVCLKGQTTVGEISAIQGNKATVIFGHIKSSVHIERLEKVSRNRLKREQAIKATFVSEDTTNSMREKSLHFHREIDIRGFRADEALQALVYFIDDAIQVGAEQVRILHGTGTGALRQTVREYLKGVTGIRSFHDEHVQFGGAGITVVELE
ncbi:mutS2 protein [Bacteroides sp. CAG:144]|jgi:mutS2 family protein|nr:mutS2 protein [Bacteroides sp. CAG:144]